MNIFTFSADPETNAIALCDQHLVKMILESAQMLSTRAQQHALSSNLYKPTHKNHPCNIWLRESDANAIWLWDYVVAMNAEYMFRQQTSLYHKSYWVAQRAIEIIAPFRDQLTLPNSMNRTPFPRCFSEEFRIAYPSVIFALRAIDFTQDTMNAYKYYYSWKANAWALDSRRRMRYTRRLPPSFINAKEVTYVPGS